MRLSSSGQGPEESAHPVRRIDRGAWNRERDLGAQTRLAPHLDLAANLLRSLPHARQPKMPGAMRVKSSRVDALAIVTNAQLKIAGVPPGSHLHSDAIPWT